MINSKAFEVRAAFEEFSQNLRSDVHAPANVQHFDLSAGTVACHRYQDAVRDGAADAAIRQVKVTERFDLGQQPNQAWRNETKEYTLNMYSLPKDKTWGELPTEKSHNLYYGFTQIDN